MRQDSLPSLLGTGVGLGQTPLLPACWSERRTQWRRSRRPFAAAACLVRLAVWPPRVHAPASLLVEDLSRSRTFRSVAMRSFFRRAPVVAGSQLRSSVRRWSKRRLDRTRSNASLLVEVQVRGIEYTTEAGSSRSSLLGLPLRLTSLR